MELSKDIRNLLDRFRKFATESECAESNNGVRTDNSINHSSAYTDDFYHNPMDELIDIEEIDFSDEERWLFSTSNSKGPYIKDVLEWLPQDLHHHDTESDQHETNSSIQDVEKSDPKRPIDTRTFTRPKRRMNRPSLENFIDNYSDISTTTNLPQIGSALSSGDFLNVLKHNVDSETEVPELKPKFNLSEPFTNPFENILATAKENIDSFLYMTPPSLVNSMCSSTFTTMLDSGYLNSDLDNASLELPSMSFVNGLNVSTHSNSSDFGFANDKNKSVLNQTYQYDNQSPNDLNSTFTTNGTSEVNKSKTNIMNTTFIAEDLNSTYVAKPVSEESPKINSGTATYKKPKSRLPSVNSVFKEPSLDIKPPLRKAQNGMHKFSGSQPNLSSKGLKIFNSDNRSRTPVSCADSLEDIRSISETKKCRELDMGELDHLARLQEQSLQQAVSTPKIFKKPQLSLWEGDGLSPIHRNSEQCLSDSDLSSDGFTTVRSRTSSKYSSSSLGSNSNLASDLNSTVTLTKNDAVGKTIQRIKPASKEPEVRDTLRSLPTMIVKPLEVTKKPELNGLQPPSGPRSIPVRSRLSQLPRPASGITGIPRPSRIPGPRFSRPPAPQVQKPVTKNWTDGCY